MVYEWDGRKARRTYMFKFAAIILATLVTAGLPAYIVAMAIASN